MNISLGTAEDSGDDAETCFGKLNQGAHALALGSGK
jgi:hypothetical protein